MDNSNKYIGLGIRTKKSKGMLRTASFRGKVLKCGVKLLSGNVAIGQMNNSKLPQYCIWFMESSSRFGDKKKRHFKALGWRRSCSTMPAMKVYFLMSHFDVSPNPAQRYHQLSRDCS